VSTGPLLVLRSLDRLTPLIWVGGGFTLGTNDEMRSKRPERVSTTRKRLMSGETAHEKRNCRCFLEVCVASFFACGCRCPKTRMIQFNASLPRFLQICPAERFDSPTLREEVPLDHHYSRNKFRRKVLDGKRETDVFPYS